MLKERNVFYHYTFQALESSYLRWIHEAIPRPPCLSHTQQIHQAQLELQIHKQSATLLEILKELSYVSNIEIESFLL